MQTSRGSSLKKTDGPRGVCVGLGLLLALAKCHALPQQQPTVSDLNLSGRFEFRANELRMRQMQMQFPELALLNHTGKNEPDEARWRVTMHRFPGSSNLWRIRLEQRTDAVRRRINYLVWARAHAANITPLEPVMATETAHDIDTDVLLFQAQSVDWSIRDLDRGTEEAVDLGKAAPWIRDHLDQVYSPDILDLCVEYLWHNSLKPGFGGVIACTNRRIELDPQVIEPYVTNAWLMWSAWVAWKLDAQKVPDGQGQADEAIRLIQKGRAAHPHSAAYHLEAADTMAPLAQHHRPDLRDFVIQYYLWAEELATDKDMRIRIRKSLGHRFREQDKIPEATHWYRAVLALDPDNKVALRYLTKFGVEPFPAAPTPVKAD